VTPCARLTPFSGLATFGRGARCPLSDALEPAKMLGNRGKVNLPNMRRVRSSEGYSPASLEGQISRIKIASGKVGVGKTLVVAAALVFIIARDANAYLDLGTGSYVLQVVLATLFASLFFAKRLWLKITSLLRSMFSREK
jgi:hypothetical protein